VIDIESNQNDNGSHDFCPRLPKFVTIGPMTQNSSVYHRYVNRPLLVTLLLSLLAYGIICCGSSRHTNSKNTPVEGLPSEWNGISDYELGGWSFQEP
jgi:hypothetical protein